MPELLLPAGGFDSGLAAIEGGADALYLGFGDFSARKQARNFDSLEYRRLYKFARDRGIRLYIALNTVILQDELEAAARLLSFLGRFPPDAVIVQDWGLASLIRERHPGMAVHASTQAAVQGAEGARVARELGASRIVLPRETSLDEMARLHRELPDLELEAFVHGALCFSFSGLCLASGLVLGRSGNRGECAQLCRSRYSLDGKREGYWFSCRDLELGEKLGELVSAGISSLKVEGRMKSPEYCFAVASLYRGLLDRLSHPGAGPSDEEIEARRMAAKLAFARSPTEGWIAERGGASLIDAGYPGHRGVPAGRILANAGGRVVLDLEGPLGLRDGLLGFEGGDLSRPVRFPVLDLRDQLSGRDIARARTGAKVELLAISEGRPCAALRKGDKLFRISSRELDRRASSPEEYEPAREVLPLKLFFSLGGLRSRLRLPSFLGSRENPGTEGRELEIEGDAPLPLDRSRSRDGLRRALSIFDESGEADFRLLPILDEIASVELGSGPDSLSDPCPGAELFIPPSVLKREKNRIYARAAALVAEAELTYARESARLCLEAAREAMPAGFNMPMRPPRAALVFPREGLPTGMPFAAPRDLSRGTDLPEWGGRAWLPLAPLVADRGAYENLVVERVSAILTDGGRIVLGLGALHHVELARRLRRLFPEAGEALAFFIDVHLYIANELSYASLASLAPGVEFAYGYLEIEGQAHAALAQVGPGFEPPLFQSLGCFLKHHVAGGACPESCSRRWEGMLADRARKYRVLVEDCVTTLFRAPAMER
jgi:putative protease